MTDDRSTIRVTGTLHCVALDLEAAHVLAAWGERGVLFLPALSEAHVGDQVSARIGIRGQVSRATVLGTVTLVRRRGRPSLPPGVEIAVHPSSVPAARFLLLVARGEAVAFSQRAPRYRFERILWVTYGGVENECTTSNLSEEGCALQWAGALPDPGDTLSLRFRDGLFWKRLRGVVRWASVGGALANSVGVRVVVEGRAVRAWRAAVAEASRSPASAA